MAMIDIGVVIEISTTVATVAKPIAMKALKQCTAIPTLMQAAARIATDFVGDEYTSEILGKRGVTGLDFTFAYDGTDTGTTFKTLWDISESGELRYLRITLPDTAKIEMLIRSRVSINGITPSGQIDYTWSIVALNPTAEFTTGSPLWNKVVNFLAKGVADPLAPA